MATNFPGPYQIDLNYTCGDPALSHIMRLNCDLDADPPVGTDFSFMNVITRDLSALTLDAAVDAFVAKLIPLFASADATIDNADLWKVQEGTFVREYRSSYDISTPGTHAGATGLASEKIFTFRTLEGNIMKIYLEEAVGVINTAVTYASLGAGVEQDLFDYVASPSAWILARDTSYPWFPLKYNGGQNESLWRKRYR